MFGLTNDQIMSLGGLLAGAGAGYSQSGWGGLAGGAQQGLLNAQQMMQARELMALRKQAADMQKQQFDRETMKLDKESRAEDAMRLALTGDYTGGLLGPDMPRAPGMAPAGGILGQLPVEYRGLLHAGAQADPKGAYTTALSLMTQPKTATVAKGATLIDTRTNKPIYENKDDEALSPIAKLQSDLKAGRITPEQYAIGVSKMGPAQTTVNVGKEQDAATKAAGEGAGKFYSDLQKESLATQSAVPKITRARQLLSTIQQGATAPTTQVIKRWAKDLGLDKVAGLKDDVGPAEALNALMIDLRLDLSQRLKGAITQPEQEMLSQMVARQGNTVEGNLMILDQMESFANRHGVMAKVAREYRQKNGGRIDEGLWDALATSGAEYQPPPMREAPAAPMPKQPPPGARTATNPQTKERIWFDDATGKWEKF